MKNNFPESVINNIVNSLQSTGLYNNKEMVNKIAYEFLDKKRIEEQISILEKYSGKIKNKKILEIGSGYGLFVCITRKKYKADTYGLEPALDEYDSTYKISKQLLNKYQLDYNIIKLGTAEKNPFPDNYFDVVYSSNVLEHTKNPQKVMQESIRVLKPGGYLQFVVPNYGSFWEGHYSILWLPYLTKPLAKIYLKLLHKNVNFLNSLQLINHFSLKKWLKPYLKNDKIGIITWGDEIFKNRMISANFSSWAGLGKIKKLILLAQKLKIIKFITLAMVITKAYTPIILTIKKTKYES